MKSDQEYDLLVKQTAYKIIQALSVFQDEPAHIRSQAHQVVMNRVRSILEGSENLIVEGHGLVTEVPEPGQTDPINTPKTDEGGGSAGL
jgi:hypothetical protein